MVRSGWFCFCFWLGGGGCGTSASSPFGVRGVMTIKMISSTSNTSISGVTLGSADNPPLPPVAIPIVIPSLLAGGRSRSSRRCLALFGQQTELIDARGAYVVHHVHHAAVAS